MTGQRPRLISLVPSATETLLALGGNVVGCTRFCEQPGITHFGGTKNPDVAAVVAATPDAVIVDVEENRREDAEALRAAGLELVVTAVRSVSDAMAVVDRLADVAGVDRPEPVPLLPRAATSSTAHSTVFVPIWRRPWMTISAVTYGASLLESIGWQVVTADDPDPYPVLELSDARLATAQLVAVPSEPYAFADDHIAELAAALPDATVVRVDGTDLFWWGIRTPAAQRRLDEQLRRASRQR